MAKKYYIGEIRYIDYTANPTDDYPVYIEESRNIKGNIENAFLWGLDTTLSASENYSYFLEMTKNANQYCVYPFRRINITTLQQPTGTSFLNIRGIETGRCEFTISNPNMSIYSPHIVDCDFNINQFNVTGSCYMENVTINGNLFISDISEYSCILKNVTINGLLEISGDYNTIIEKSKIGNMAIIGDAAAPDPGARVTVDVRDSKIDSINITESNRVFLNNIVTTVVDIGNPTYEIQTVFASAISITQEIASDDIANLYFRNGYFIANVDKRPDTQMARINVPAAGSNYVILQYRDEQPSYQHVWANNMQPNP